MVDDYFDGLKKTLSECIPEFDSPDFSRMGDEIRRELKKKESVFLFLIRSFKTLVVGDWNTAEKKKRLVGVRDNLLRNSLYAETIDRYYDLKRKGGLTSVQVFETCCIGHQLIVFVDGEGSGTVTEQNYLSENYCFQGKVIFFIKEGKFDGLKEDPASYVKDFPTIITYRKPELLDKTLVFARLRLYRLAGIIQKQSSTRRGLKNPRYMPWKQRMGKSRGK